MYDLEGSSLGGKPHLVKFEYMTKKLAIMFTQIIMPFVD